MTIVDILRLRLKNQGLVNPSFGSAKEVVAHMGIMQSQDYAMSKWAVGLRMKNGTEQAVDKAIDKGEILRTHVLRPTWHLVSPNNIYWMLDLTAARILHSQTARHKELGLSKALVKKSNTILEKAVSRGEHLTREELLAKLQAGKIATDENRAAHLLFRAELDRILCSGSSKGGKRTYASLEQRVPKKETLPKEEALAKLAGIYFKSHGPATLADFTWWSGLSPSDAKEALELAKEKLVEETVGDQSYWFSDVAMPKGQTSSFLLLPAFDEFLISYKDRTAAIQLHHQKKAFSSNGIFWPTLLVNGKVEGLWKRTIKKDTVLIEPEFFEPASSGQTASLSRSAKHFGKFLDKQPELLYK